MQDDQQTRFLVDLEHLLKTPLLQAVRRSDFSLKREQPTRDDVLVIRALCARTWTRLSTFRMFSRLASGENIQPNLAQLTARELLSMIMNAVQDAEMLDRRDHGHHFDVSKEINAETMVEVDVNLFDVALREVIDNAVRYSLKDSPIKVEIYSKEPQNLTISISNKSFVTRPDEIGHLFERGYRSSQARLVTADGSGIGLYLVKSVIDAQKGTVHFQCQGQMMTVTLQFPVVRQGGS